MLRRLKDLGCLADRCWKRSSVDEHSVIIIADLCLIERAGGGEEICAGVALKQPKGDFERSTTTLPLAHSIRRTRLGV